MNMFSTKSVDYFQRIGVPLGTATSSRTVAPEMARRVLRVRRIGREQKEIQAPTVAKEWSLPTVDLVGGLYGYRIPIAFLVSGTEEGVNINLGTWSTAKRDPGEAAERRLDVVGTILHALFQMIDLEDGATAVAGLPLGGLAVGVPTAKAPIPDDPVFPWDKIVRAMSGTNWSVLIMAQPVREEAVNALRHSVLNEMRAVQQDAKSHQAPSPLAEFYVELMKGALTSLSQAAAVGAWRTACYLLGDGRSYPRLASAWRSIFSGQESLPEPVRVFDLPDVRTWKEAWAMPDDAGTPGPGHYTRPYEFQTLLTSAQLAAYVHLPRTEAPGYAVDSVPRFDAVAPQDVEADAVHIGDVVHAGSPTTLRYSVKPRSLTRHVMIAGVTGSGKSTTIFRLLENFHDRGIPFLVVEPAKAEYRSLLGHPSIGSELQVFTLGEERGSPFRMNPFDVPQGVTVFEQIDALRAVMSGSFQMWTPLPQVLEKCLHEVYADRGWNLSTNDNARGDARHPRSAPTLGELAAKVREVTGLLGYEEKIRGDIEAALTTRIDSLRAGGKGRMLDVSRSIPIQMLLERPTILELEPLGDDDDKAFLMGLILLRLVHHRRVAGPKPDLEHVLVIEEAHRLLSARGPASGPENADPKAKVVEMFSHLLSEVRAYGQGIIIADQVPVRLAPDVLKNTGLKIAHRIVANDDRTALAGAMSMSKDQDRALTTLPPGRAAVFGDGDDSPLLVQVPNMKDALLEDRPTTQDVAKHMSAWRAREDVHDLFVPLTSCLQTCESPTICASAQRVIEDDTAQRTVEILLQSVLTDAGAMWRLWPEVVDAARVAAREAGDHPRLLTALAGHAAHWFAETRGARAGWSYAETDEVEDLTVRMLVAVATAPGPDDEAARALEEFRNVVGALHTKPLDSFPSCRQVCGGSACRYRLGVEELVARGRHGPNWDVAMANDTNVPGRPYAWAVSLDAAYDLVEWPTLGMDEETYAVVGEGAHRASFCFAQQMVHRDKQMAPRMKRDVERQIWEQSVGQGEPQDG